MATLGIHKDFLLEFAGLEKAVQKRVHEVFDKFEQHRHAGLHLEKLEGARDPRIRTIRITRFWRGVVLAPDGGDSFLLLKVMRHDDAIAWAVKHRATVNSATQGIELRNDVALERATTGLRQAVTADESHLFARVSDADLARLGVDADLLPLIRMITGEGQLDALHKVMPEQQYDVLAGLAAGMDADDVWREVVQAQLTAAASPAPTPATATAPPSATQSQESSRLPTDELSAAMARARGRIALVSGPDELMEILARPFDAWRVFLHPSQHRVAYRPSYGGPARVHGGPGTGKTVVALHRALHLARRLPPDAGEAGEAGDGSILLTTYTRDLAADLRHSLELLVPDEALRARVRVVNVDALANQIVREARGGTALSIVHDHRELLARWGRITRRHDLSELGVTDAFLDQEWRHVVLAQGLRDAEDYLKASRAGRGTALGPLKRARVWRAISAFTDELKAAGEWTFLQVCGEAARLLDERAGEGGERPFAHVVIDEAQDLHPAQWRLLRALAAPGPDDLFIAGDTHQRIYGNKVSLRSMGISVAGRSARLRVNYRTTHEILAWSTALLTGERVDDMDGGDESLSGYRSTFHGERPRAAGHGSKAEEIAALVEQVRQWTEAEVAPHEIGIAVRFIQLGKDIAQSLERAGLPVSVLTGGGGGGRLGDGVRIGTMHRMKGLEFRCMAVAGVNDGVVPMRNAITPAEVDAKQHQEDLAGELSLLFVACTRAREALRVSWHGPHPSPFLAPVVVPAADSER